MRVKEMEIKWGAAATGGWYHTVESKREGSKTTKNANLIIKATFVLFL